MTCDSAHLGDADKKGAYPARAKLSVLVTLRMKRSPKRRQPMRRMSCPSCGTLGCAAMTGSCSLVGSAGSYRMSHPSAGNPATKRRAV